ncbi:MAG: phosphatase PAP2 family protein [Pseudomonadota bacterium]
MRDTSTVTVASWITWLGNIYVVVIVTIAATLFLFLRKRWFQVAGLWLTMIGSGLSILLLKDLFYRPRPDAIEGLHNASSSFPSGNSIFAAALFGALLLSAFPAAQDDRFRRLAVMLAVAVPLLVASSRVILSEHYVSDTVAGLSVGFAWALIGGRIALRRKPEKPL